MSDKSARTRIGLTLTKVYMEALDNLVEMGLYLDHQVAIRNALRLLFRHHKIESFRSGLVEEVEKIQE
ncbi:unnamed protein product [marine sediment metagenome]|uniref:Ribbon-helix-helix protein CopG domain-containing protein n=1 Tax=marine sediment metagenome TaxID=412755 RepID=X1DVE3_9ZZZZ